MAGPACPVCGDAAVIEYDSSAGNAVCTTCGYVVDENTIVAEVTFGESSNGAAVLQGSSLGATDLRARIGGPRGRPQQSAESRAETLAQGMRKLTAMAHALRLGDSIAESAHRFFTLAVSNGFVMGRRSPYVLASCIYVACRLAKLPTMLIDISDLLQVNVFIVGATYLKLVKELCLQNIPLVDPSLYISRFASLLEFGEDTQKVAYDAARLVKRFDTDWMTAGRRPAGIAGASLLIAARMNGFRRSVLEIVQVVKMADVTIKKRLEEFRVTASGKMTVEEFRTIWLEEAENPPALKKNRRKERKKEMADDDDDDDDQTSVATHSNEPPPQSPAPSNLPPKHGTQPTVTQVNTLKRKTPDDEHPEKEAWGGSIADSETEIEVHEFKETDPNSNDGADWYDNQIEQVITQEVESHLISGDGFVLQTELDEKERRQKEEAQKIQDARLDDLDDDELDQFILNDKEVEMKTRVWMELNREYLEKVALKKEREANGELKVAKKYNRTKSKPRDSENPAGLTVEESVKNMINSKKKLSSKINYAIADSLFGKAGSSSSPSQPNLKKLKPASKRSQSSAASGHTSLLNSNKQVAAHQDEDDDDDDDDHMQEEEEIVHDAEFAMLKRDNLMMREEDDFEGWGEEA
ncbi:transcription factor TFIIIB subunit brf1 [Puccinia graminis f. sp. tritici]|uniref:B-related factor 1 n=1 Tax=Puccinia graminis f. sp. tritici TaxID=56615 RepID=A0A5B0RH73_PUCGR|nr:transcription factor TFIIIB subunit brf1 [Puccinia graminis f. sp. tritici]